MTKIICDKCGKEVRIPYSQTFYKIICMQRDLKCHIDLCSECSERLDEWLKEEDIK